MNINYLCGSVATTEERRDAKASKPPEELLVVKYVWHGQTNFFSFEKLDGEDFPFIPGESIEVIIRTIEK